MCGRESRAEYRAPVRPFAIAAIVLALTVTGACGGGDEDEDLDATATTGPATTLAPPTTVSGPTVPPADLTLRITDVRLTLNANEADNGIRVLLPAGVPNVSVTLRGVPSPNRAISVCQARELERRMDAASCRTPQDGEAATLPLGATASGVEIVQLGAVGSGAEGNAATLEEVTIRYSASSREVNVRLAQIAAGEAGGRPAFGLTPPSADGSYRASLAWNVIAVFGGNLGTGQLELVQGGSVANQAQGSADVRLTGTVPAPAENVVIRAQNVGSSALVTPKLSLLLP